MMNKARQRAAPLVIEDKAAALNAIHQGAGAGAGGGGGGGEGMGIDTDEALNLLLAAWRMHRQQQVETRVGEKEKSAAAQRQRHRLTVGLGGGACAACEAACPRHIACSRHAFFSGPARPRLWEPVHPSVHLPSSLPLPCHPSGHPPALSLSAAHARRWRC